MRDIPLEDLSVKDIMDQWPDTVPTFIRLRLKCVGCPIAPFHTIADAAREHGADLSALVREIESLRRSQ